MDEGRIIDGDRTFQLITTVDWSGSNPSIRLKDIISMAWAGGNSIGAGSIQSSYSMFYTKDTYANGLLISSVRTQAPAKKVTEKNAFPGFAVQYDIPGNTLIPYCFYNYISLTASTRITADSKFTACGLYGHQTIAGTPSVNVTVSDLTPSIKFNRILEEYFPGTITVNP